MTGMIQNIKRAMRQIRKSFKKSRKHRSVSRKNHKGGAIYSFDLSDRVGGQPARIALNGTRDGDCPKSDTKDLGFVNYGLTKGGRRSNKSKNGKKSKCKTMKRKSKH